MENNLDFLASILQIVVLLLTIIGESPTIGLFLVLSVIVAIASKGADSM